jgi:hypothetical protein
MRNKKRKTRAQKRKKSREAVQREQKNHKVQWKKEAKESSEEKTSEMSVFCFGGWFAILFLFISWRKKTPFASCCLLLLQWLFCTSVVGVVFDSLLYSLLSVAWCVFVFNEKALRAKQNKEKGSKKISANGRTENKRRDEIWNEMHTWKKNKHHMLETAKLLLFLSVVESCLEICRAVFDVCFVPGKRKKRKKHVTNQWMTWFPIRFGVSSHWIAYYVWVSFWLMGVCVTRNQTIKHGGFALSFAFVLIHLRVCC